MRILAAFGDVRPATAGSVDSTSSPPRASRSQLTAAILQLGSVVGQELQTYWDGNRTWFSGRIIEARLDPIDAAAWVHVEYYCDKTCEWVRLDDHAFSNPVLYSLSTRMAWCRVKGFPWWPAQQLLYSKSSAQETRRQLTGLSGPWALTAGGAMAARVAPRLLDDAPASELGSPADDSQAPAQRQKSKNAKRDAERKVSTLAGATALTASGCAPRIPVCFRRPCSGACPGCFGKGCHRCVGAQRGSDCISSCYWCRACLYRWHHGGCPSSHAAGL
jgi:hypothetical protein